MRIPGSENMRVVAEGDGRGALMAFVRTKPFLSAVVQPLEEPEDQLDPDRANAYRRAVKKEFEHYAEMVPKISNDVIAKVLAYQENGSFGGLYLLQYLYGLCGQAGCVGVLGPG